MEQLEQRAIQNLRDKGIDLVIYKRYVDDCFIIGKESEIDCVLQEFNIQCDSLKFTLEKETDGTLRFLDLKLSRNQEKVDKIWYTKQDDGRYLDFYSESPYTHKKNTAIALIDRALKLSDVEKRVDSIEKVKRILHLNNYPDEFIHQVLQKRVDAIYNSLSNESVQQPGKYTSLTYIPGLSEKVGRLLRKHDLIASFKPVNKIKNCLFTKLKDPIPRMKQTNVVYSIPCECGKEYCGQTSQTLEKRIKNHKSSFKHSSKATGLTQHANESSHDFQFEKAYILEKVNHEGKRKTAETLHIKLKKGRTVNRKQDAMEISKIYSSLIKKLRETPQFARNSATTTNLNATTTNSDTTTTNSNTTTTNSNTTTTIMITTTPTSTDTSW